MTSMTPPFSPSSYDAVPYSVSAFPQTDPDRLAVIGRLFGIEAVLPHRCRVLELGCASGGNLIPMAMAYRQSEFVGIDLSPRQIEEGQAVVCELGLANIKLEPRSILDVGAPPDRDGSFDYILAHGVYSWVPPEVQAKILDICRRHLTANGIAYISYNAYPGWRVRGAIRDMLCHHTANISDPLARVGEARNLLEFLATCVPGAGAINSDMMGRELAQLLRAPDTYLLHEYLEDFNEPLYFRQFADRLRDQKLQYIAEAQIATMLPARFGPQTERHLRARSPDRIALEDYMDFLSNPMFRQSLVCRADVRIGQAPDAVAVAGFHVASPLKPESPAPDISSAKPETFVDPGRPKVTTPDPLLKAALVCLARRHPLPIPFAALMDEARTMVNNTAPDTPADQIAGRLLDCYTAGAAEFTLSPPAFVIGISDRPCTTAYVRLRARAGLEVTNLRFQSIALTEAARVVLAHLDGLHERHSLITLIAKWLEKNPLPPAPGKTAPRRERAAQYVDYILPVFANSALLVA